MTYALTFIAGLVIGSFITIIALAITTRTQLDKTVAPRRGTDGDE